MTVNPRALAVIRQERADALRRKALAAAANRLEATAGQPTDKPPRLRTGKRTPKPSPPCRASGAISRSGCRRRL